MDGQQTQIDPDSERIFTLIRVLKVNYFSLEKDSTFCIIFFPKYHIHPLTVIKLVNKSEIVKALTHREYVREKRVNNFRREKVTTYLKEARLIVYSLS